MADSSSKPNFMDELRALLTTVRFGSIEIYVQDHVVTQVTVRNITKTKVVVGESSKSNSHTSQTLTGNLKRKISQ